jgi:serine protease Do
LSNDETDVLNTIEKASKSVVNISTITLVHKIFYQAVPVGGMGSGTIIDTDGLILTNNRVVAGAEKINVTLWNNQVLERAIAGSCAIHDIAIVKLNGKDLQSDQLGDSDKLRVGQHVYANGNPFGLTGGPVVVSPVNQTIKTERGLIENLVQTDAAINLGNSGSPLVDIFGKAVTINTGIIPYAQGIGFAIPINSAKSCTDDIITEGSIKKPWLGIVGLSITREIARYYNWLMDQGVLVTRVTDRSPAEAAGMSDGDIIPQISNVELDRIENLVAQLHKKQIVERVRIYAFSNSRERFCELKLGEAP